MARKTSGEGVASMLKVKHPRHKYKVSYTAIQADGSRVRRFAYFLTRKEADEYWAFGGN
jgi:hypothetical protein